MTLKVRRVITGHDTNGKAKVLFDEVMTNPQSNRPGADYYNVWTTEGFPVNNDGSDDLLAVELEELQFLFSKGDQWQAGLKLKTSRTAFSICSSLTTPVPNVFTQTETGSG